MPSSNINQPLTIASLSKDSVDIGNFSGVKEQTVGLSFLIVEKYR